MKKIDRLLIEQLREQLAIEEDLCTMLEEQIDDILETKYSEARNLLISAKEVLIRHFIALNETLDKLEMHDTDSRALEIKHKSNGIDTQSESNSSNEQKNRKISRILRDDYSALNLVTISNTLLHTLALAIDNQYVADLALRHLENLTPLVVRLGELMTDVVTLELHAELPEIDLKSAKIALQNTKLAWKKASS
jgi:hypothetical protein